MDLDFTKLEKLSYRGFYDENEEKQGSNLAVEPLKEDKVYNHTSENMDANTGHIQPLIGIEKLQRKADLKKTQIEQENRRKQRQNEDMQASSNLLVDLSKNIQAGGDIYSLFIQAVEIIGLTTGNKSFTTQAIEDIKAIYGRGLKLSEPLQIELDQAKERLEILGNSYPEEVDQKARERIKRAIEAHKELIERLTNELGGNI